MSTQSLNPRFAQQVKDSIAVVCNQTRSKIISAADVWNIQRQTRGRVYRRIAL